MMLQEEGKSKITLLYCLQVKQDQVIFNVSYLKLFTAMSLE
jgi:hypothetical protein